MANFEDFSELSRYATRRLAGVEFAGVLVRDDDAAIYISDPQGTWIVARHDVLSIEDWEPSGVPQAIQNEGRPVSVSVRHGATIYELRPWRIDHGAMGPDASKALGDVFTLGGTELPITGRGIEAEERLAELERAFSRRLGWDPADASARTTLDGWAQRRSSVSKTLVINDGYCDVDDPF